MRNQDPKYEIGQRVQTFRGHDVGVVTWRGQGRIGTWKYTTSEDIGIKNEQSLRPVDENSDLEIGK